VGVVAKDRDSEAYERFRALAVEIGDKELGLVERRFGEGRRERDLVARCAQHRLNLAAQQQIRCDSYYSRH
jgi:hypothetical protein